MLGFRGLYALGESAFLAERLNLPVTVQEWAKRTALSIQVGHGRAGIVESVRPNQGAPPLEGRFQLINTFLLTVILLSFAIILGFFTLQNLEVDDSTQGTRQAPNPVMARVIAPGAEFRPYVGETNSDNF